jgi:hypothetical protein
MEHLQWPKLVEVWLSTVLQNGPPRVRWYTTTKQRIPIGSTVLLRMVSWDAASFWSRQQRILRGIEIYDAIIWHRTAVLESLSQRPGAHDQQKLQYQNYHVIRTQRTLKRIKLWSFIKRFGLRGVSSHYPALRTKTSARLLVPLHRPSRISIFSLITSPVPILVRPSAQRRP